MSQHLGNQDKKYFNVAILIFHGVDILDFAGPLEILSHVSHNQNPEAPDRVYRFTIIGREQTIQAAGCLSVKADRLIKYFLEPEQPNGTKEVVEYLSKFDILIVPGGPPNVIIPLLEKDSPEMRLVRSFASVPCKHGQLAQQCNTTDFVPTAAHPRLILSICVGAFFLGSLGLLAGIPCTTHHRALKTLAHLCGSSQPSCIVEKRYVDGGLCTSDLAQPGALKIVTAGGISSGLDATLWVVANQVGGDMAKFVSRVMEYNGKWEE
ncbi:class I glutamine amidotransferase-like protein [Zopfia rhizophila CBS 207.26]|uniref:Class I glutamine amidotransferase-like protein n=1 Tax=Zopfia rhizophila CBS 207.26 TaxID=1314779 RepID=A0A6A6EUV3_9PEZI|nr:class I glutamine amidotransferase-like protein [Zopfia rhizophila CBS 207.26]